LKTSPTTLSQREFIALMALMMSLVALAIDAILPALGLIESSLHLAGDDNIQMTVSLLLLGLGMGQLVFGPLSDTFGRKPLIYAGYLVFIIATLICINATSYQWLLLGRFLQGFGLAAPRVLSMAIIRDQYAGRRMAQIMSFVMVFFILVPMLAPLLGQAILWFSSWRTIFYAMLIIAVSSLLWFSLRQPETLNPQHRKVLSLKVFIDTFIEVITTPVAVCYTVSAGILSGAFIAYLASAQPLFGGVYGLGDNFALCFASIASVYGIASFINGKLVVRKGMSYLVLRAFAMLFIISMIFLGISLLYAGLPSLVWLVGYFALVFACVGIIFGNLNALAMEPLGHLAGMGAAIVGAMSTLIAAMIAITVGTLYDGTVLPLVAAFAVTSGVAGLIAYGIETFGRIRAQAT